MSSCVDLTDLRRRNFHAAQWRVMRKKAAKKNSDPDPMCLLRSLSVKIVELENKLGEVDIVRNTFMNEVHVLKTTMDETKQKLEDKVIDAEANCGKIEERCNNTILQVISHTQKKFYDKMSEMASLDDVAIVVEESLKPMVTNTKDLTEKVVNHRLEEEKVSMVSALDTKISSLAKSLKMDIGMFLKENAERYDQVMVARFREITEMMDKKVQDSQSYMRNIREALRCQMSVLDEKLDDLYVKDSSKDCDGQSPMKKHKS